MPLGEPEFLTLQEREVIEQQGGPRGIGQESHRVHLSVCEAVSLGPYRDP